MWDGVDLSELAALSALLSQSMNEEDVETDDSS